MDGSGTINPAALDSLATMPPSNSNTRADGSPRGIKRSRSPDKPSEAAVADNGDQDESKPRKRSRYPSKATNSESPSSSSKPLAQASATSSETPKLKPQTLPKVSSPQQSPPKSTPNNKNVKALPTVRDHTTDQLTPEGDEYIPREHDEAGEKKVTPTGHLTEGREYKCRTFFVPNRGEKLFMLATECARNLNYRDSYLLFNKNRSLFKIIASQVEKDDLIAQEILPFSYRSRQIAIVTARSMYRQFGARIITNGRRVRDDYWESKARKQGFTEEDLAGEKRPGNNKQTNNTANDNPVNSNALNLLQQRRIEYTSNGPGTVAPNLQMPGAQLGVGGIAPAGLPMIDPTTLENAHHRDYGNVQRPRQDISGTPYEDRTQPSPMNEIVNQASQVAQYNTQIKQESGSRNQYLMSQWHRDHHIEPILPITSQSPVPELETLPTQPSEYQSPPHVRPNTATIGTPNQQHMIPPQQMQSTPQMMNAGAYAQSQQIQQQQQQHHHPQQQQQQHPSQPQPQPQIPQQQPQQPQQPPQQQQQQQQSSMQSPVQNMHQGIRQDQMHQRNPSFPYGSAAAASPSPNPQMYGYPQNSMWPPQQPHPSPMSQPQHIPQYPHQQSPHPQQSPHHPPPQMSHAQNSGSMQAQAQLGFHGNMPGLPQYQNMARGMYQQNQGAPQQYLHQSSAGQQPGMHGWAGGAPGSMGQQAQTQPGWPQY